MHEVSGESNMSIEGVKGSMETETGIVEDGCGVVMLSGVKGWQAAAVWPR